MNGTNPPDRIRQQQDICSYFDLQAIGDFAGNDKMELFWRNYGMFSTETRVWLMDMDNDSYSVESFTEPTTFGWQVVSMNPMTGRYLG